MEFVSHIFILLINKRLYISVALITRTEGVNSRGIIEKKPDVCRMKILLLGSGGREHALALRLSSSGRCSHLYIAPGNPGTALCGTNVNLDILDFEKLAEFCEANQIELLVVGPEEPLVRGLRDFLETDSRTANLVIVGPGSAGAMLEGSKDFSKAFMIRNGIPTARYQSFQETQLPEAVDFLKSLKAPYVLKASGLAAGKGVLILADLDEAMREAGQMLAGKFGEANKTLVIEEFLDGIECSVFILTDGEQYQILPEAKDYKRIGEGDTGLNTGGMGAVSPVPFYTGSLHQQVLDRIIEPTIKGLRQEGIPYKGFIFFGLMIVGGEPYVIEYNCRMGDPESEVVIPRIKTDLVTMLYNAGAGKIETADLETDTRIALTVMCVSGGYPGDFQKGIEVSGLENVRNSLVFHAGTKQERGRIFTNGGRVLACTSLSNSIEEARQLTYESLRSIHYDGIYFRKDIGLDLLNTP
jgi:phosphoribosylamine---glycine ligase